jgi:hypothetical protein
MPRVDLFRGGADARKLWEGVCLVVDLVLCRMEAVGVVPVSVPKPECLVGFESLGGGDGEGMSLGLWLRLRESSRSVRAFPSLLGGEDCIMYDWRCGGSVGDSRVAS